MFKFMPTRNRVMILAIFLLIILIIFSVYSLSLDAYNRTPRSFDQQSEKASSFSIRQRTGSTDSWVKNVERDGVAEQYFGTIYDMTLTNFSESLVAEWVLTLQIPEDCYLNNAWCGQVEIHQFADGTEAVQRLDLRDYNAEEITLTYRLEGSDLMIPLSSGDYLVYYPNEIADEYPILAMVDGETSPVVAGIIFYTEDDHILPLDTYRVDYTLHTGFSDSPASVVILILAALWILLLFVFASIEWSMRKAQSRYLQDERIIHQSIGVFTHFFEAKDIYTNGHSQRVAGYSRLLAEKLDMTEEECRNIYYIALMHDCGKCYIPDAVLKKDGKLTPEEFDIIKSHTVRGAGMLRDFTAIDHMCDGVLYHHERYDGRGYPEGLKGEAIPIIGRLICICDSFDAMNSKRCYRDRLSREKILSELHNCNGTQFDPELTEAFLSLIREGKIRFSGESREDEVNMKEQAI